MASLGIDYGTGSWKTALLVEGRSPELRSFGGADDVRDSIAEVDRLHPALPIVLPSGFGIPLRRVQELDDRDLFEIALRRTPPASAASLDSCSVFGPLASTPTAFPPSSCCRACRSTER